MNVLAGTTTHEKEATENSREGLGGNWKTPRDAVVDEGHAIVAVT